MKVGRIKREQALKKVVISRVEPGLMSNMTLDCLGSLKP